MNPSFQLFDAAVHGLRGVSNGLYQGPQTSSAALEHAFSATAGLNPGAVAAAAKNIGGKSDPENTGVLGTLGAEVLEFFAEQAISEGIESLIEELFLGHQRNSDIGQSAGKAGEAMECIDQEAARTCNSALGALTAAMGPLLGAISATNPVLNPLGAAGIFQGLVRTAEGLINATASLIMGTCQARDEAIGACLEQLRGECEQAATAPNHTKAPRPESCVPPPAPTPVPAPQEAAPAPQEAPKQASGGSAAAVPSTHQVPPQAGSPSIQEAGVQAASVSQQPEAQPAGAIAGLGQALGSAIQGVAQQVDRGVADLATQLGQASNKPPMQPMEVQPQGLAEAMQGLGITIDIDADIHFEGCEGAGDTEPAPECPPEPLEETPEQPPQEVSEEPSAPEQAAPEPAPTKAELAANAGKPHYGAAAAAHLSDAPSAPPAAEAPAPEAAVEAPSAKKAGGWS
ncbi:hypothetical protein [Corynebacterium pseudopelargi]|uniref:Uncharacterized protein n=1 Tax=Corynebacterium pseudopelargi TaxID=2080757 RepID=A0A3G6IZ38_9CORY|nr:hypothetical protein [Corynebacterium pseudopelargi]AZA09938.1 hypothetical protein CPPEL_09175 [Corynebacterium pseudopelargi]